MIFREEPDTEDAPRITVPYRFLAPRMLRIREANGQEIVYGFGVGDLIYVLQPSYNHMIRGRPLREIPLADGGFIIGFGEELPVERAVI